MQSRDLPIAAPIEFDLNLARLTGARIAKQEEQADK